MHGCPTQQGSRPRRAPRALAAAGRCHCPRRSRPARRCCRGGGWSRRRLSRCRPSRCPSPGHRSPAGGGRVGVQLSPPGRLLLPSRLGGLDAMPLFSCFAATRKPSSNAPTAHIPQQSHLAFLRALPVRALAAAAPAAVAVAGVAAAATAVQVAGGRHAHRLQQQGRQVLMPAAGTRSTDSPAAVPCGGQAAQLQHRRQPASISVPASLLHRG